MAWKAAAANENGPNLPVFMQVACKVGSYAVNNEIYDILLCLLYLWVLNTNLVVQR